VKSRLEAEAQRRCAEGLSVYLEKQHRKQIAAGFTTGIISGIVCAAGLYTYNKVTDSDVQDSIVYMIPLVLATTASTGYTILTVDQSDDKDSEDFNAVCDELAADEEEEEEDEVDDQDSD